MRSRGRGLYGRWNAKGLCMLMLIASPAFAQVSGDTTSRWSLDLRYGSATFAASVATLPLTDFEVGRYVELSLLPNGAPAYGIAYATSRDSSVVLAASIAFQTMFTTLDVSDSSSRDFQQGEYPVATLRISQVRGMFELRAYTDLPLGIGVGMWRAGLGLTCVWASSVNVLDQAKTFPGIQSIDPHASWLLAMDAGLGYRIPGTSLTLTANFSANLHMEFVSNNDFVEITMAPSSPYRFQNSSVSPIYLSLGVLVDL
jgi:hypothetical protein